MPAGVREAFTKAYPSVRSVRWSKEDEGYEAAFKADRRSYEVELSPAGEIIEVEEAIRLSWLPDAVRAAIRAQFAGYTIDEAAKVTSKGVITYEVELERGKGKAQEEVEATFDANGKLLGKESSKDSKDSSGKDTDGKDD